MKRKNKRTYEGFWILIVAAVFLEGTACFQYFMSRAAIQREAMQRAQSELRKAELEIELHTVEMETAARTLAMMVEKDFDSQQAAYAATRFVVSAIPNTTSVAVAYKPGYFSPDEPYFEACSSRISPDSIYTRQIGSKEHDYTGMEWYQNGMKIDSCWWSEPYLDDSGSQTWVVSCSYPVYDAKGERIAVVCVDLSLDYLQTISEYLQMYKDSYYSISSGTGLEIVPKPDTIPGKKYFIFEEEIDATGWHIAIIIPDEVLFAELRRTGFIISLMMLIGLLVLAFMLIHAGRTISQLIQSREQNQRMESELEVANTIQTAMLPKVFPPFSDRLDLNIYGMLEPAKEVGGDLYDFYIRHDKLFFCIGDVSGKGVPAALVMATARSLFRSITSRVENAAHIVEEMNNALSEQNDQNMFLTLFLGVLELKTGELSYCCAGHNAPVSVSGRSAELAFLPVEPNLPLGIEPGFRYSVMKTQMHYNDVLFLYTDGLTEAENKEHAQYGEERMFRALEEYRTLRPRDMIPAIREDLVRFVNGAKQSDDLTMLAIRYQTNAIIMRNDIQQIPTLAEWIDGLEIPAELNMQVNLALEEAVSNVMLYAYPDTNSGQVFVEFVRLDNAGDSQIIFTISDSGIPFDPTQKPPVDTTLSAEERSIGGLGIHLVRQLMDKVEYKRQEDKNILTLTKKITKND